MNPKKTLFDATETANLTLKNRLFRSATWEGLASGDGTLHEELYAIYDRLAAGGVGAIITGGGTVSRWDPGEDGVLRWDDDKWIPAYQRLADTVHRHDCRILAQLNLPRFLKVDPASGGTYVAKIAEISEEEIHGIVSDFGAAAARVKAAGFDGIQIHSAFEWLLNSFLNPQLNQRTDRYGGSEENRCRIHTEILSAIRENAPGLHVTVKFSLFAAPDDLAARANIITAARRLSECGIDSIEACINESSVLNQDMEENDIVIRDVGDLLKFALAVKAAVNVPVIAVGDLRDIDKMETLLNTTGIDYLAMSRPLICEPELPNRWKSGDRSPARCITCNGCYDTVGHKCVFG